MAKYAYGAIAALTAAPVCWPDSESGAKEKTKELNLASNVIWSRGRVKGAGQTRGGRPARGIGTIRTLGILRDASALELVDLGASFAKLRNTSFRAPASFMDDLLDQEAKRRTSGG